MERRDDGRRSGGPSEGKERDRDQQRWEHGEMGEAHTGAPERSGYQAWERGSQGGYARPGNFGYGTADRYDRGSRGYAADRDRWPADDDRGGHGSRSYGEQQPARREDPGFEASYTRGARRDSDRYLERERERDSNWTAHQPPYYGGGQPAGRYLEVHSPAWYDATSGGYGSSQVSGQRRPYGPPYDYRSAQQRQGRAPRSYQRADERIRDEICEVIVRHTDIDASDVDVQVSHGEVTLTGLVENRACKRELEDVAERVFGVADVHNHIKVKRSLLGEIGDRLFGHEQQPGESERSTAIKSGEAPPDDDSRKSS